MKQDRQQVRTAQDLERKYDLSSLVILKKAVQNNETGLTKTNAELESFINETLENLNEIQSQIDGNITTYFYSGVPTLSNLPASEWTTDTDKSNHIGDLYYDQDTGYAYRFALCDGVYKWLEVTDSDVTEALALANQAKDTADSKRRVFITTPIPPYDEGDLWLNNEELYVCILSKATGSFVNTDFDKATKYTDDSSLQNFVDVTFSQVVEDLTTQIDGKVTTWYYNGTPTLENEPASTWETDAEKSKHVGDLYYDKDTGYSYIFKVDDGVFSWERILDSDLTQALALANSAQDTADNKRRVFISTPEPPYENGDLWLNDGEIYVCQISKGIEETYATDDFIEATNYTDDSLAIQVGNELTVVSGTVTKIKEAQDEFSITLQTTTDTVDKLGNKIDSTVENMSYSFGTKDLSIANSNDPVNARINNTGLKVYTYKELETIVNNNGMGANKLIVVGESQLSNIKITKAVDENGNACTDFHHLISNIQSLTDLED